MEFDARQGNPRLPETTLKRDLQALVELGAVYVDVGLNDDWIAAELPLRAVATRPAIERVVGHLTRLKDLCSQKA